MRLILAISLTCFLLGGCESRTEKILRSKVASFEDSLIPISQTRVIEKDNYYIGFRKTDDKCYYLLFVEDLKTFEFKDITVCSDDNLSINDNINDLILGANRDLNKLDLELETVDDLKNSVYLTITQHKIQYDYAICKIDNIRNIDDISSYIVVKCSDPNFNCSLLRK